MIRPPQPGAAFTEARDGDTRNDTAARASLSETLGVSAEWATVRQVHGADTVFVEGPGEHGRADALWTTVPRMPLAVFTADCFGLVLRAERAVGVAHAGWRGTVSGVAGRLRAEMEREGHPPMAAAVGPGIGPCCFEVGPDVAQRFPADRARTTWGTTSVDLRQSLLMQLAGLETWVCDRCTRHDEGLFSHRRDATGSRLAAVGWIP
jgi:YfiH family protein